jgi:hypothetical protein
MSTSNLGERPSRVINLVQRFSAQSNRAVEGNLVSPFRYARSGDNRTDYSQNPSGNTIGVSTSNFQKILCGQTWQ